jgi:hypothetical protein
MKHININHNAYRKLYYWVKFLQTLGISLNIFHNYIQMVHKYRFIGAAGTAPF